MGHPLRTPRQQSLTPPLAVSPIYTPTPKPTGPTVPAAQTQAMSFVDYNNELIKEMLESSLLLGEDWHQSSDEIRNKVLQARDEETALALLVEHGLLTAYQSDRIRAGTTYGLVLGNYRVLERIGAGGMGVVFRGEHSLLRRPVAVKVLPLSRDQDPRLLLRFRAEMRVVAALQHPNIVAATDAGHVSNREPNLPVLHYLVMEYVPGQNLEELVEKDGPLEIAKAAEFIHQIAGALAEAHSHNLVHRDMKPSNILVAEKGVAKLLDFGLAQNFQNQLTEPGSLLGTVDYMAPEQARDPRNVDIRADIFGLGGTLYWCLTGKTPFAAQGTVAEQLNRRMNDAPPSVREKRPEVSADLDAVITRMMAVKADDRFQTPQAVMRALAPHMRVERNSRVTTTETNDVTNAVWALSDADQPQTEIRRVLIVDDDPAILGLCQAVIQDDGTICDIATDAIQALQFAQTNRYGLVLLDVVMPGMTGAELLPRLRETPNCHDARILMMSGLASPEEMGRLLLDGADDFLAKPFSPMQLQTRVKAALDLREAHTRADLLRHHLNTLSADLERNLETSDAMLRQSRMALVQALSHLVQFRTNETDGHLRRVPLYCRILCQEAAKCRDLATHITPGFVQDLERAAPLHDIGFIALPDHILQKPGKLDEDERIIMQSHTVIGAQLLHRVAEAYGRRAGSFLYTAVDVVRHHHEAYDGTGYPDRLAGDAIPLSARIVALADVYDARRSRRAYRPALPHGTTMQVMLESGRNRFDPRLLEAFRESAHQFERIFTEVPD
jgi:response regulator RpfG family c-di-GMP phosphodiesterase/serine/threonine protein kinase